jgi:hypothetical protein
LVAAVAATDWIGLPHAAQNFVPGVNGLPQPAQNFFSTLAGAASHLVPHPEQNDCPSASVFPQVLQVLGILDPFQIRTPAGFLAAISLR